MNVLVLGAGAIGLVFGGFLAKSGHRVVLLGRDRFINPINRHGLELDGIWGNHRVTTIRGYCSFTDIREREATNFDAALLAVRAYDTRDMLFKFVEAFPKSFPVVSLQNGLGNLEEIVRLVGRKNAIGGRVVFGAEVPEPGRVRVTLCAGEVMIGAIDDSIPWNTIEGIARLFSDAGIPALPTKEIEKYMWGKVLYDCALNGLGAILGVKYRLLIEHESTRILIADIVSEIFEILEKQRRKVDWPNAEAYVEELFTRLLPETYEQHSSMLRDIRSGKRTEIDALNGAIVRLGEEYGTDVPVNYLVTKLIKVKEKIAAGKRDE